MNLIIELSTIKIRETVLQKVLKIMFRKLNWQ